MPHHHAAFHSQTCLFVVSTHIGQAKRIRNPNSSYGTRSSSCHPEEEAGCQSELVFFSGARFGCAKVWASFSPATSPASASQRSGKRVSFQSVSTSVVDCDWVRNHRPFACVAVVNLPLMFSPGARCSFHCSSVSTMMSDVALFVTCFERVVRLRS